jgi:dTDP-4-dehydrorhamnose 3,5-epimerase-like enzyme
MSAFTDELKEAIKVREPHLFKNAFPDVPEFQAFLDHKRTASKTSKSLARRDSPTYTIVYSEGISHEYLIDKYPGMKHFRSELLEVYGPQEDNSEKGLKKTPFVVVSESIVYQNGLPRHRDDTKQHHWCCIGSSYWTVWGDDNVTTWNFTLTPGDVIYIPVNMAHGVTSLTETRGSIVLAADIEPTTPEMKQLDMEYYNELNLQATPKGAK